MAKDDVGQLIDSLSNKELIIRMDINKTLKLSKFKLGELNLNGEFGISFRDIEGNKKEENVAISAVVESGNDDEEYEEVGAEVEKEEEKSLKEKVADIDKL
ncbi:conserved hypothetical protein [Methanococcus aeolicus Nankai-3]|uniref:Uncharacterized protein n=1 Tax=Methanococcus aeolicus (strain ATCC BAA-1280 / DSM 17508 / OCM 812 / Nankai-3) TaxID=419665 RepID=A6UTT0_META3|nr:hypothetical protein [Methanococcus aeolicus]ABR55902.1 conserved hypothetical protein [Methanococcus aeolicus Nankai-3]